MTEITPLTPVVDSNVTGTAWNLSKLTTYVLPSQSLQFLENAFIKKIKC